MTMNSEETPRGARLQPHPPGLKERGYQLYENGAVFREAVSPSCGANALQHCLRSQVSGPRGQLPTYFWSLRQCARVPRRG
jgi:hypothetical protein